MPSKQPPDKKKVTNEKPISLYPLPLEEVVKDLFAVKPLPKERKKRSKDSTGKSST